GPAPGRQRCARALLRCAAEDRLPGAVDGADLAGLDELRALARTVRVRPLRAARMSRATDPPTGRPSRRPAVPKADGPAGRRRAAGAVAPRPTSTTRNHDLHESVAATTDQPAGSVPRRGSPRALHRPRAGER